MRHRELATLTGYTAALALLLISSGCANVKRDSGVLLQISTSEGIVDCQSETQFPCLRLRVRNVGDKKAVIGLAPMGQLMIVPYSEFTIEGRLNEGQWKDIIATAGSFEDPPNHLTIRPGGEAAVLVLTGEDFRVRYKYSEYRVRLTFNSTEQVYSGPLELGPRP